MPIILWKFREWWNHWRILQAFILTQCLFQPFHMWAYCGSLLTKSFTICDCTRLTCQPPGVLWPWGRPSRPRPPRPSAGTGRWVWPSWWPFGPAGCWDPGPPSRDSLYALVSPASRRSIPSVSMDCSGTVGTVHYECRSEYRSVGTYLQKGTKNIAPSTSRKQYDK